MPQYKNRMYRKEMLTERRHLLSIIRAIEAGEALPTDLTHPQDAQGQPLTLEQLRARVAEIDGLLDRVHKD